ncbi:MAG: GGDEF domain-containing protein, partial [Gammaproteobacteria bacterium]|nr:GGDEF domain-containing protein [Gammaproteobacteria bacterium]
MKGMLDLSSVWRAPEPTMMAAAAAGEILLAKFRIAVLCIILIVPTYKLISGDDFSWAVFNAYIALGIAIGFYWYVTRHGYRSFVGFSTQLLDILLISMGLFLDVIARETALAAVNNKGTFDLYFLAILGASLRYDRRICLFAGGTAMLIYSGFIWYAENTPDINNAAGPWLERYGIYFVPDQVSRILFLFMGTALSYLLVVRGSNLLNLAIHDPLTGLYNRSFLREHLHMSIEQCKREGQQLAVALIDVDHFKRVNDQHGHTVGDNVLKKFAGFLRARLREVDLVSRYGGEEFCIVFSNTDAEEAVKILSHIKNEIKDHDFKVPGRKKPLKIEFSAGIAAYGPDGEDMTSLINTADQRLLYAKQTGRDRIVSSSAFLDDKAADHA